MLLAEAEGNVCITDAKPGGTESPNGHQSNALVESHRLHTFVSDIVNV